MRYLFHLVAAEWLSPEELYCRDIGFVRPVHRKQYVLHAERHHGAEEGSGGKISAAGDDQIFRQILRRSLLEAAACGRELGLVVDPMEHERQALTEMAENKGQIGKRTEHASEDEPEKMYAGLDAEPQAANANSS